MPQSEGPAQPSALPSSSAAPPSSRWPASFPRLMLLILGVGLALRLLYVTAPLVDAHRWRQVDTAAIARVFYEERFNPLRPEAVWGGPAGAVESEFPLLPALAALAYLALGPWDTWGRLIVIAFSLGAVWFTYVLGRQLANPATGLAAAAIVSVSPGAVFYGRAYMPDTLMVCFSLAALAGFNAWARGGGAAALSGGASALALAILVKLPGVLVLAPIAACVWLARGTAMFSDRRLLIAIAVPVAVASLWYWHAYQIYLDTGLTFGVFGTTKTYPPDIAVSDWPTAFSKWSTVDLLTDWDFYNTILSRLYFLHLTPAMFALALIGLVTWKARERFVVDAWLAVLLAFVLGAGWGHLGHDYYQLPLAPVLALYAGVVARPVFDRDWLAARAPGWRAIGLALAVGAIAWLGFWHSGVIQRHFRPEGPDVRVLRAGDAIRGAAGDGALIVVVDDYGVNSPMLLYFARAKGWSFDSRTVTAPTVRALEARGARFFAATRWSHVRRAQPELHEYLQTRREVPLRDAPADTVLFELAAGR